MGAAGAAQRLRQPGRDSGPVIAVASANDDSAGGCVRAGGEFAGEPFGRKPRTAALDGVALCGVRESLLFCATWAVRASAGLFSKLRQQASELARLQYQFIETQEETARRFSHELHDELGQVMTAVKANLAALRDAQRPAVPAKVHDCLVLVDRAIADVREMSQLLRPTVLDDFGLDPALRSLAESFSQRTGIRGRFRK